jgi:hypothetical protein
MYFFAFLTSALDGAERPASSPYQFIPLCLYGGYAGEKGSGGFKVLSVVSTKSTGCKIVYFDRIPPCVRTQEMEIFKKSLGLIFNYR